VSTQARTHTHTHTHTQNTHTQTHTHTKNTHTQTHTHTHTHNTHTHTHTATATVTNTVTDRRTHTHTVVNLKLEQYVTYTVPIFFLTTKKIPVIACTRRHGVFILSFSAQLKSKVGLALAKAAALRICTPCADFSSSTCLPHTKNKKTGKWSSSCQILPATLHSLHQQTEATSPVR
jgi:hypothetical protein